MSDNLTYIELEYYHRLIHKERNEEEYGDWCEAYDFEIYPTCRIVSEKTYEVQTLDFEVKSGDKLYVVYAVYSYGDSFGHANAGSYDFIEVYKTKEKAEETLKSLHYNKETDKDTLIPKRKIVTESGKEYEYCIPWIGYFESLDVLEIQEVVVR